MHRTIYSFCIAAALATTSISAQAQTIHVAGRYIIGPCGDTLTLKGVNYAPYNWGYSPDQSWIAEIASTGANCVRLPWYAFLTTPGTPETTYGNISNLYNVVASCITHDLIPIIELHDLTCQNDSASLLILSNFYSSSPIMAMLNAYSRNIIINVANESLFVDFDADPVTAQATYVNTYTTIVTNLRNAGVTVPIMIDAPDCGTNLDVLADVGPTLEASDSLGNLIFSAHAYWYAFANNDPVQMQAKVDNALASGIPFVFGEVANLQDDSDLCQYTLDYASLLDICTNEHIGWMAWSWDNDGCSARQISTNGLASSLTPYGEDIVNNASYGLSVNTVKSHDLVYGNCEGMGIHGPDVVKWSIAVDAPARRITVFGSGKLVSARLMDITGKEILLHDEGARSFSYPELASGIYVFSASGMNGQRSDTYRTTQRLFVE
ncbi:MAG: cellulase family glycosylhydrolase [Flavobacteriales bacterium]